MSTGKQIFMLLITAILDLEILKITYTLCLDITILTDQKFSYVHNKLLSILRRI